MKARKIFPRLFEAGFGALLILISLSPVYSQDAPYVEGEMLVKYKSNANNSRMGSFEKQTRLSAKETLPSPGLKRVKIESGASVEEAIKECYRQAGDLIEYAEPNYIVHAEATPNDPDFSKLWAMRNDGSNGCSSGADVDAQGAWDIQTGGTVVVAVIDTGVDYTHPDLAANMWVNGQEIPGNGVDDDGNGFVDDCRGWDFKNNDSDPMDDHAHGTHCAGTIAAAGNNGTGVAGICWQAKIMPLKFLAADGGGSVADAVKALHYAVAMGANVTSNSWGGGGYSQSLRDAIEEARKAGVIFVAAAGNTASDNDTAPHYPSNYDCDNIIAVAATDCNDQLASFSCYGFNSVDIGAPGVSILSTVPGGGYEYFSGTSMATPHVAGAAALLWARTPSIGYAEIVAALLQGAERISSLDGKVASGGRLNLLQALNPESDGTPPSPVADLSVVGARMSKVELSWTSTGDDGMSGTASSYDLRFSGEPITDANWDAAARFSCPAGPQAPGAAERVTVAGLFPTTQYYFALKVRDNRGNNSSISNVTSATTTQGEVVFNDDAESGDNGWAGSGLWHRTMHRASSGSASWYFGQEGIWTYDTGGIASGTLTSPEIDLSGYQEAILMFNYFRIVESYGGAYDVTAVEASRDGGTTWSSLWRLDTSAASSESWAGSGVVALAGCAGGRMRLRLSFDTVDDSANGFEGWYVDDIRVVAEKYDGGSGSEEPASLYLHTMTLEVNKLRFGGGDTLTLSARVRRGILSPYPKCNAYVAAVLPNGAMLFLKGNGTFSGKIAPFVSNVTVQDIEATIASFTVPQGLPGGTYSWLAVLAPSHKQAVKASSWASNLSEVDFTVNR